MTAEHHSAGRLREADAALKNNCSPKEKSCDAAWAHSPMESRNRLRHAPECDSFSRSFRALMMVGKRDTERMPMQSIFLGNTMHLSVEEDFVLEPWKKSTTYKSTGYVNV